MKHLRFHAIDSATSTYIAALSVRPTDSEIVNINRFVRALKDAGIWGSLDGLYIFRGGNEADSKINLKNPGQYNLTKVNSPVFTPNVGWKSNLGGYLDTNYNVSAAGGNYKQNSASLGVVVSVDAVSSSVIGISGSSLIVPRNSTGNFQARLNNVLSTQTTYNGVGLHAAVRTSSSSIRLYRRNALVTTASTTSSALVNQTINILSGNNGASLSNINLYVNMAFFGGDLSGRQMLALSKAYSDYDSFYGAL